MTYVGVKPDNLTMEPDLPEMQRDRIQRVGSGSTIKSSVSVLVLYFF